MATTAQSLCLFVLAGLCEISGGYLVWQAIRNGRSWFLGVLGALILVLYGIIPTFQRPHFGRVYAVYGGVFVIMSLVWGWWFDKTRPDIPDLLGAILCILGVFVIMYWPRK